MFRDDKMELTINNFYIFNSTFGAKEGEVYPADLQKFVQILTLIVEKLCFAVVTGREENLLLLSFKRRHQ